MSTVCEHGQLRRACNICEFILEVASLRKLLAKERDEFGVKETNYAVLFREHLVTEEAYQKQIELWQSKAKRLLWALKKISLTVGYSDDTFDQFRKMSQDAISEFDGEKEIK